MPALEIPGLLLPRDGRFGSGPAKVPVEALQSLMDSAPYLVGTSHRQQPVQDLVQRVRAGLSTLYALPDGYEVLVGNGGATVFLDMAVHSLVSGRSAHGCYGDFTARFAKIAAAAPHLGEPDIFEAPAGEVRLPETTGADTYAWAHVETSTGALAPIQRVGDEDSLVIIDGTSAAGAIALDLEDVDAYFFAPQYAFASEAGLWLAFCSPRALDRMRRIAAKGRWIPDSLNLSLAYQYSMREQTLNTPSVITLFLLAEQLSWLLENGGLDFAAERCAVTSGKLYAWAEAHPLAKPLVTNPDWRSPVVVTLDFDPSVDARELASTLRANGIVDVEPYGNAGRNQLRIATFPAVESADVEALIHAIEWVLHRMVK